MAWEAEKISSTAAFNGVYRDVQTSGLTQNADFRQPPILGTDFPTAIPEAVPAASRVTLGTSNGVIRTGPNQYAVTLSLSTQAGGIQLTPGLTDAQNNVTTAIGAFSYRSRSTQVAVSATGLLRPVSRTNGTEVLIQYPVHQVNASFPSASPSGAETIQGSLVVTVLA